MKQTKQQPAAAAAGAPAPQNRISLALIHADPHQPRKYFDEEYLQELAQSILQVGVIQAISIRPHPDLPGKYMIITGECRWRSSKLAAVARKTITDIPATVLDHLTNEEILQLQITENLLRQDVNPVDEALAFQSLQVEHKKTDEELAAMFGKSKHYIRQRIQLTNLADPWRAVLFHKKVKHADALRISRLDEKSQMSLYKEKEKSIKGLEPDKELELSGWDFKRYQGILEDANFDITSKEIDPVAGPCTTCRFNSSFSTLFPGEGSGICHNKPCFAKKEKLNLEQAIEKSTRGGTPLVTSYNSSYENKKFVQDLKQKGITVLVGNDYDELEKPEPPEPVDVEYWEDDPEGLADMKKGYEDELQEYKDELEQYNQKKTSYTPALVVDGTGKGSYIYIQVNKKGAGGANLGADEIKQLKEKKNEILALQEKKYLWEIQLMMLGADCDYVEGAYLADGGKGIEPLSKVELQALAWIVKGTVLGNTCLTVLHPVGKEITHMVKGGSCEGFVIEGWAANLMRAFILAELKVDDWSFKNTYHSIQEESKWLEKIALLWYADDVKNLRQKVIDNTAAACKEIDEKIRILKAVDKKPEEPAAPTKKSSIRKTVDKMVEGAKAANNS